MILSCSTTSSCFSQLRISNNHSQNPPPAPPTFLRFNTQYREKLTYVKSLGIIEPDPKTTNVPSHEKLDQIVTTIDYLKSKGFSDADIRKLSTFPKILSSGISDIEPVLNFLTTDVGATNEEACRIVVHCPALLSSSVEEQLKPTFAYLTKVGVKRLNKPSKMNAQLLNIRVNTLEEKLRFIQDIGFTYEEAVAACSYFPAIFGYSIESNMRPKFEYLQREMQRSVKEIKRFPQFFGFSLTNRIMTRHLHMKQRGVRLPLESLLWPSDEKFYGLWK